MISLITNFTSAIESLAKVHRLLPWLIAYVLLLFLPNLITITFGEYYVDLANRCCLFILLAVGLNIVKGFCGQVTVGHIGLYAIGAVTSALLAQNYGLPFWLSAPLAILVTCFAGLVVGLPSVRLEGAYLALATLGLGESVRIMIAVTPALGSSTGIMMIPAPTIGDYVIESFDHYFYLVMTAAIIGIYFSFVILNSSTGRAFKAIREDVIAASVSGINVPFYKLLAFVISAIYAGLAGALFAHMPPGYLHHNNFTVIEMVTLLLMVVLGGIGNIWGGVVGAIVVTVIYDQTKDYYFYQPLIFGITMVFLVVFMPRGIGGVIEQAIVKRKFIEKHEEQNLGTS